MKPIEIPPMLATSKPPQACGWFLLCENEAVTTRAHPVLGAVPICERCDAKVEALSQ